MDTVIQTLNAGSGIDVRALTDSLVEAERSPRVKLLDDRQTRVDARISAMAQFRGGLDGVVTALDTRIRSGSLSGIAAVSDNSVLGLSVSPGSVVPRQTIEVRALAQAQTLASAPVSDQAAAVGLGTLTIRFGTVAGDTAATGFTAGTLPDLVVTVGADRNSLTGLRDAINDAAAIAGAPIQARILTDAQGSRLQLRGTTGAASGFVVETAGAAGLSAFAFGVGSAGLERTQVAADARIALDGLELRRSANRVTDLVPGATLVLGKAAPGQPVIIEAQRSPTELSQAVRDLAQTLNELVGFGRQLSAGAGAGGTAGALVSDGTTRRVLQQLGTLGSRQLVPANGTAPTRLTELGLTVDRTGQFVLDEAKLARAANEQPEAIEALLTALNVKSTATTPAGPLRQMAELFKSVSQGSGGQPTALQRESAAIARERTTLETRIERLRDSYTRQFTQLDRAVGESKRLQTYLQQQIDLWTGRADR
jgi:flagellar hook-associated protein 2